MKKRGRSKLSKVVSNLSQGIFNRVIDLVLFGVYYTEEMSPFSGGSLYQRFSRIENDFDQLNSQTLRRALQRSLEQGWINKKLEITPRGQKRLEEVLPKYEKKPKWNGKWYIVAYDIPESKKYLREILRHKLRELKFGQLHKSLFICPYNLLGDVEKIVKQYNLSSYVLLAVSDRLGREPSSELAERIWHLDEVNQNYKKYIEEVNSKKLSKQEALFKYLVALHLNPQLPKELLPEDWKGEEAHDIYKKILLGERLKKIVKSLAIGQEKKEKIKK